jgi:hypothetical protein
MYICRVAQHVRRPANNEEASPIPWAVLLPPLPLVSHLLQRRHGPAKRHLFNHRHAITGIPSAPDTLLPIIDILCSVTGETRRPCAYNVFITGMLIFGHTRCGFVFFRF